MPIGDAQARQPFRSRRPGRGWRHRGFTYLLLLFAMAMGGVGLAALGEQARHRALREQEDELAFRGTEIARAIASYVAAGPVGSRTLPRTVDDLLEDRIKRGFDTLIRPWQPPADDATPFTTLVAQVKAYEPGQGFIDGGGFQVIKETDSYLYVQFEALKKGYIDDVEFYMAKDGAVQVRSGSRVGSSDFGVNAKRLNYIAAVRK